MPIISDKDQKVVRDMFNVMDKQVKLVFFEKTEECQYCEEIDQLLSELVQLSDKLTLEKRNINSDQELAGKLAVDKAPAIVLLGEDDRDYGIRFYGIPAGYEFSALLEDITMVSMGESGLQQSTRTALEQLKNPVNLKVFVTPT
jgi:glutaredoxin-like protein